MNISIASIYILLSFPMEWANDGPFANFASKYVQKIFNILLTWGGVGWGWPCLIMRSHYLIVTVSHEFQ